MKGNQTEICLKQAEYFSEPLSTDADTEWKATKIVKIKNSEEEQIATIYKTFPFSQNKLEQLRLEINTYESLKTSKKFSISGVCFTSQGIAVCRKKDKNFMSLKTLVEDKKQIDVLKVFTSATEGVSILHQSGIIHKDLNLDTIFSNGKALLRIGFPLFNVVDKLQRKAGYFRQASRSNIYNSPELKINQGFSFSSDIWALGIIFLQILIKQIVGECNRHQLDLLIEKIQEPYLKLLVEQMLHSDPRKRPNIQSVKRAFEEGRYIQSESASLIKILTIPLAHSASTQKRAPMFESNIKNFAKKKFNIKRQNYTITIQLVSQCQMFIYIDSEVLNRSYATTISNRSMPFSLKKYFTSVTQLYPYLFSGNKYLVFNDSAQVQFYHTTEKCLELSKKIEAQSQQNSIMEDDLPFNCMGEAKILSRSCTGALIGPDLLLIPAQALYSRQKQQQTSSVVNFSIGSNFESTGYMFSFRPEFQTCTEEQKYKYNYGLVFLEEKVNRSNTITLLYDYSEQIIRDKISLLNFDINFIYIVGNHRIGTQQLAFDKDKIYFNCEASKGDLIFIKFSNGRVAAIGMVTAQFQGYLFSEEVRQNLLAWLFENKYYHRPVMLKNYPNDSPLRIFPAKSFDFSHEEVPFTLLQNLGDKRLSTKIAPFLQNLQNMANQGQARKIVPNFGSQIEEETPLSIAVFQQSKNAVISSLANVTSNVSDLVKILRAYEYELGPNCWKTSAIYYWIGKVYQQKQSERAKKYFQRALKLQQEKGWNPLILLNCYYQLATLRDQDEARYLDEALKLAQKYHDYRVQGQVYRRYGQYSFLVRQYPKCIQNYETAISTLQKGENQLELLNTLNNYINICFQIGKWFECAKSLEKMTKISATLNNSEADKHAKDHWTKLIATLNTKQTVNAQILDIVKRMKLKYYPETQLKHLGPKAIKDDKQRQIN